MQLSRIRLLQLLDIGISAPTSRVLANYDNLSENCPGVRTGVGAMAINQAFCGHGIYAEYGMSAALKRFERYGAAPGSPAPTLDQRIDRFVQAPKDMEIATLWLQLFSRTATKFDSIEPNASLRRKLLAKLAAADIDWVGWGYCAGYQRERNKTWIRELRDELGLTAFVIDAEPGNLVVPDPNNPYDEWEESAFDEFVDHARGLFGKNNLAISTWPVLLLQEDHNAVRLMQRVADRVGLFAPQAYWMNHPGKPHYDQGFKEEDYPKGDPKAFIRLVIDSWRQLDIHNPLAITGQAYWGEANCPPKDKMDAKVDDVATHFTGWDRIVGFNWYHAGGANTDQKGSMSDAMIKSIAREHLGHKPYQPA